MRHLGLAFAAVAALALAPSAAFAQDASSADVGAARALGQEGVKLAEAGNCKDAIDKLARSEKLFHAPTTLEKLGECQVQVGKIVDGTENLNRVVRESLAPNAPAAFTQAQERAKKILAEAKPKIAKLKIAVAGPADNNYVVKLDGEAVPLANLNMNRPTDPGEHVVEATAPGYKVAHQSVTLSEGGSDTVALTLEVDPNTPKPEPLVVAPVPVQPQPVQPQPVTEPPREQESTSRTPAYVTLGVGAAGVAVGTVFGLLALGKKSDVSDACAANGGKCPVSARDDVSTGRDFGTVSTVGFVVGAVGLAAGVYLYLTEGPRSSSGRAMLAGPQSFKLTF